LVGIGNSLGSAVREAAINSGGTLPILFSMMRTRPKRMDSHPEQVCFWTSWTDSTGAVRKTPSHVLNWSRGDDSKKFHYALVCHSTEPLTLGDHGPFDPSHCRTHLGNPPGGSQVTALLHADLDKDHSPGTYNFGFRATLVEPWTVKLVMPRTLSMEEREIHSSWKKGDDWRRFVERFRGANCNPVSI
jgi:hypothetical protein